MVNSDDREIIIHYAWLITMDLMETIELLGIFEYVSDIEYSMSLQDEYDE